ncbi:hypothetical protein F2Q69_00015099 [Brassica cretica]|uniref:Uncharacterized protein n=1 Tax=Brassica cretica TaxID=69181 RepID=A0A8S9R1W2_BRACR|nr:hypothetical protein F2Q69_00015099 [Brassica cretica]
MFLYSLQDIARLFNFGGLGNGRREAEDEEEKMIEQPHKKSRICTVPFSLFSDALNKDIVIDAVFDNGEDVALDGGDSDSDGYLDEVLF